jgi:glycosyltransferase involved in cell wall biosynthesis
MEVVVSAIICTHNRAVYLRKAIGSLIHQTLPRENYEIVVVDNGSSDRTADVVRQEFGDVPMLRYVYEPMLGLAYARNAGCNTAQGKYVAYLDDDAVACPSWLEKIVNVFETFKPRPGCVGGKVDLLWESPRPPWVTDNLLPFLAYVDWSSAPIVLTGDQYVAGVNFAFPKQLLQDIGGFDPRLDRRGNNLLSNGDVLVVRQLQLKGYNCLYLPDVAVQHHVSTNRLSESWFIRRLFWQGVSNVLQDNILTPRSRASLLKDAYGDVRRLTKPLRGGYLSPRRIYWHLKAIPFGDWLDHSYLAGKAREKLYLAFRGLLTR